MAKFEPVKKACFFCHAEEAKNNPSYTDVATLKKLVSERGKILSADRSGLCAKHQRRATKQIKYARHLALMPFTVKPY